MSFGSWFKQWVWSSHLFCILNYCPLLRFVIIVLIAYKKLNSWISVWIYSFVIFIINALFSLLLLTSLAYNYLLLSINRAHRRRDYARVFYFCLLLCINFLEIEEFPSFIPLIPEIAFQVWIPSLCNLSKYAAWGVGWRNLSVSQLFYFYVLYL